MQEPPKTGPVEARQMARWSADPNESATQAEVLRSQIERPGDLSENLQDELVRAEKLEEGAEGSKAAGGWRAGDARGQQGASPSSSAKPDVARGTRRSERPITALVADDHAMVREGMAQMLSLNDDIEVVAQAGDGREAVALARETRPDVVILDVEMPVMGAQAALKRLLEFSKPPKVIVVTVFADPRLVRELLGLGASAFLAKSSSSRDLISTVRSVARNQSSDNVIISVPRTDLGEEAPPEGPLSRREAEVLRMVARGAGNKEVAETLHLSETTVKRHLSNIYDKVGVRTRGEAVSRALSEGWVSSRDIAQDE